MAAAPGVAIIKAMIVAGTDMQRDKIGAGSLATLPRAGKKVEADPALVARRRLLSLPGGERVLMMAIVCSCQQSSLRKATGTGMTGAGTIVTETPEIGKEAAAGETVVQPAGVVATTTTDKTTVTIARMTVAMIVTMIEAMIEARTEATIVAMTGATTVSAAMAEGTTMARSKRIVVLLGMSAGTSAGSLTAPVALTDELWTLCGGATPWTIARLKRLNAQHGRRRRLSLQSSSLGMRAKRIIRLW